MNGGSLARWGGMSPEERFWLHVDRSGGPSACWPWRGALSRGYGHLTFRNRSAKAHRIAFALVRGEIPAGLQLDHLCRNPRCVNPAHLEPVSGAENSRRSPLIGRHPNSRNGFQVGHPAYPRRATEGEAA